MARCSSFLYMLSFTRIVEVWLCNAGLHIHQAASPKTYSDQKQSIGFTGTASLGVRFVDIGNSTFVTSAGTMANLRACLKVVFEQFLATCPRSYLSNAAVTQRFHSYLFPSSPFPVLQVSSSDYPRYSLPLRFGPQFVPSKPSQQPKQPDFQLRLD